MLYQYLDARGYALDYAADGVTGLHLAVTNDYQAIVLDLNLPGMDGLTLCEKLRNDARKTTPVLMLTARDTLADKIVGLDTGADDYLVKPFELGELDARLRAVMRRTQSAVASEVLTVGDLVRHRNVGSSSVGTRDFIDAHWTEDARGSDAGQSESGQPTGTRAPGLG